MTIADGADTTHLKYLEIVNDLQVDGNCTVTGTLTTTGAISDGNDITLANGKAIKTDTTDAHTAALKAYYTTGTAYETLATLTNGTTPTLAIAASTHGAVTIDGAVIGGTTPAAATVTTMTATGATSTTAVTATATTNQLTLGAASHKLIISSTAPAGASQTLTFPDPTGADSVAYLALAQTFTNKTLTSPTLTTPALGVATATSLNGLTVTTSTGTLTVPNGVTVTGPAVTGTVALINPAPQAGGSTLPVTAAMSGKPILLDTAGGTTATLPAASGSGNKYVFIVSASTTSAAHKILANSVSDFIIGNAAGFTGAGGATKNFTSAAATNHSIQMPNSGSQPSGGIIGDRFLFVDIGANLWHCDGFFQAGTTPTTPFSSATS